MQAHSRLSCVVRRGDGVSLSPRRVDQGTGTARAGARSVRRRRRAAATATGRHAAASTVTSTAGYGTNPVPRGWGAFGRDGRAATMLAAGPCSR